MLFASHLTEDKMQKSSLLGLLSIIGVFSAWPISWKIIYLKGFLYCPCRLTLLFVLQKTVILIQPVLIYYKKGLF